MNAKQTAWCVECEATTHFKKHGGFGFMECADCGDTIENIDVALNTNLPDRLRLLGRVA